MQKKGRIDSEKVRVETMQGPRTCAGNAGPVQPSMLEDTHGKSILCNDGQSYCENLSMAEDVTHGKQEQSQGQNLRNQIPTATTQFQANCRPNGSLK